MASKAGWPLNRVHVPMSASINVHTKNNTHVTNVKGPRECAACWSDCQWRRFRDRRRQSSFYLPSSNSTAADRDKEKLSPIDSEAEIEVPETELETHYYYNEDGQRLMPPIPISRKTSKGFLRDDGKPRSFHYGWRNNKSWLHLEHKIPFNPIDRSNKQTHTHAHSTITTTCICNVDYRVIKPCISIISGPPGEGGRKNTRCYRLLYCCITFYYRCFFFCRHHFHA